MFVRKSAEQRTPVPHLIKVKSAGHALPSLMKKFLRSHNFRRNHWTRFVRLLHDFVTAITAKWVLKYFVPKGRNAAVFIFFVFCLLRYPIYWITRVSWKKYCVSCNKWFVNKWKTSGGATFDSSANTITTFWKKRGGELYWKSFCVKV